MKRVCDGGIPGTYCSEACLFLYIKLAFFGLFADLKAGALGKLATLLQLESTTSFGIGCLEGQGEQGWGWENQPCNISSL